MLLDKQPGTGLKLGLVIQIIWITHCPGQAGLTLLIKYLGLTLILYWITCSDNCVWSWSKQRIKHALIHDDDGSASSNSPQEETAYHPFVQEKKLQWRSELSFYFINISLLQTIGINVLFIQTQYLIYVNTTLFSLMHNLDFDTGCWQNCGCCVPFMILLPT